MKTPFSFSDAYHSALESAFSVQHTTPGLLRMLGRDRLDLLDRMSTNEVGGLETGRLLPTVLTTAIGRIVDSIEVLALPDEAVLLTTPGRDGVVREWLQGYVFFQDDVRFEPWEPGWSLWGVYGPEAAGAVRDVLADAPDLEPGHAASLPGALLWKVDRPTSGYRLLLAPECATKAQETWNRAEGEAGAQAYEVLRIEAGVPEFGREFDENSIPLEAGLWHAVSFQKGCYIGQEIIARMESRGRQARQLVGIRLESAAAPGDPILQSGERCGALTSVAESPRLGWIALAVAKPQALEQAGGRVAIGEGGAAGQLVNLPFRPETETPLAVPPSAR